MTHGASKSHYGLGPEHRRRDDLSGKVALVSGGTSGIGRATVEIMSDMGADVLFLGRSREEADEVRDATDGRAVFHRADQRDGDALRAGVSAAVERFGGIDYLFASAGLEQEPKPLVEYTDADIDKYLEINLRGSVQLAIAAAPHIIERQGSIVLCSSFWGVQAGIGTGIYAAAKAGLTQFAKSLAQELAPDGVRVNTVSPGGVDTAMFRRSVPEDQRESWAASIPLGRAADPDELADAVIWLLTRATYVTAHDLVVDGGVASKMGMDF